MKFDQPRKINKISMDTNVLLDLPLVPYFESITPRTEEDKKMLCRVVDSYTLVRLCLAENISIGKVGIKVVEKEIQKGTAILPIFHELFPTVVGPDRAARRLAGDYMAALGIESADAMLLAIASVNNVDIFLSWNRDDISNEKTQNAVETINKRKGTNVPFLCTPTYFLDRLVGSIGSKSKALCLSNRPVPRAYRLKFFPSR